MGNLSRRHFEMLFKLLIFRTINQKELDAACLLFQWHFDRHFDEYSKKNMFEVRMSERTGYQEEYVEEMYSLLQTFCLYLSTSLNVSLIKLK